MEDRQYTTKILDTTSKRIKKYWTLHKRELKNTGHYIKEN
jgi:hypothetical protein